MLSVVIFSFFWKDANFGLFMKFVVLLQRQLTSTILRIVNNRNVFDGLKNLEFFGE